MEAIPAIEDWQALHLPLKTIREHSLRLGGFAHIALSEDVQVLGQVMLASPQDCGFIKFSTMTTNQSNSPQKVFQVKSIETVDVINEASEIEILAVTSDVRTTIELRNSPEKADFIMKCLKRVIFNSSFTVRSKLLAQIGIKYLILKAPNDKSFFKISENTKLTTLRSETCFRRRRISEIPLGGLQGQTDKLKSILETRRQLNLSGFLISGPSGSGKTSLIRKVAQEADFFLLLVHCSEVSRPHPGETEKLLQDLFKKADLHSQEEKNVMLILEDIDLITLDRAICQLKSLIDSYGLSMIIGATTCIPTNVPDILRRPGRFTHELFIQVPNLEERMDIIQALEPTLEHDKCLEISQCTQSYLGADLASFLFHFSINASISECLRLTAPSGFKSGIGSVQLNPLSWSQIGGLKEVKDKLQSAIMWPLLYPGMFQKLDVKRTKGLLMYGPPGCGKTVLVRAMASMAGATFLSISAASIFSPYVGDSEKSLAQVFHKARLGAPSVLFIDEIDGLVTNRDDSGSGSGVQERVLSVLLNEMDGIGTLHQSAVRSKDLIDNDVIVVGATNRPELLDAALMRPGRFDKIIHVPPPDVESRLEILKVATFKMPLSEDVDLAGIASICHNFSGADCESLCKEAALHAMTRHGLDHVETVSKADFDHVLASFKPSITEAMVKRYSDMTA